MGVLDRVQESNPVRERTSNEEISEVCSQFLDECVPGGRVDGHRTDHADHEAKEEEWQFDDQPCPGDDEQLQPDADWNDYGPNDFVRHDFYDAGGDRKCSTERNDDPSAKDDRWTGQTHDPRAADVV